MKKNRIRYATAFISSTFADMKSERNLIMYNVFPKVKRWAFERGIVFDILDLRWGINENQAENLHHTIKICLERVNECDPLFVCLLGDRYGWIPDGKDFDSALLGRDVSAYEGISATELEILQALDGAFFDGPPKSCVFLFRDSLGTQEMSEELRRTYLDAEHADKLRDLKKRIARRNNVIRYSATLEAANDGVALGQFRAAGVALEEVLTDRLIEILRERYGIDEEARLIGDDPLVHQQFHLQYLSMVPQSDRCVAQLQQELHGAPEHGLLTVRLNAKQDVEHQVAHFIAREQENTRVIYRFMGIDHNIRTANDLMTSMAYELSGDPTYLEDLVSALLFLKEWFERTEEKVTLIVAGIDESRADEYTGMLCGLKLTKTMLFTRASPALGPCMSYNDSELEHLATHMLRAKAKTLLPSQMRTVLAFADGDYALLRTAVSYLCTFADYESVDRMVASLGEHTRFSLTKRYLDRMIEVQNRHLYGGILQAVIELLCFVPLPITRKDIVETIGLSKRREGIPTRNLEEEIDFSLCFAKDFIEEHDARFIIRDKAMREAFGVSLTQVIHPSPLLVYLYGVYLQRILSGDESFGRMDGRSFCQLLRWGVLKNAENQFKNFVLDDPKTLYVLARVLTKRDLLELFKALAMQAMGYDTQYLLPEEMSLQDDGMLKLRQATAITTEKLFSIARAKGTESEYLAYYKRMFSITPKDLADEASFCAFVTARAEDNGAAVYHRLLLPERLKISASNAELYTAFDAEGQAYQTRLGVCDGGFLFLLDAFTGEAVGAFAVPFDQGKPISTFYSDHKMHVLFERGVVAVIHLGARDVQFHRFESEASRITAFQNYYFKGYNVMVQDERTVKLLKGLACQRSLSFREGHRVTAAFLTFDRANTPDKMIVLTQDAEGKSVFFLLSPQESRGLDSFTLYKSTVLATQDGSDGRIYLEIADGTTFVLAVEEDKFCLDLAPMRVHHAHNGEGLTSQQDYGIFFCGKQLLEESPTILAAFGTGSVVGFVTVGNELYCVDNGY